MPFALVLAVAGLTAAALVSGTAAHAKTCKEAVVSAKARSAAQLSDASRERVARDNAISNWSRRARDTHGWRYSFWRRAEGKDIKCGGGASAKHCTASAKPCRLL
jgi:hypothetical protein